MSKAPGDPRDQAAASKGGAASNDCPTGCHVVPPAFEPIEARADAARDFRVTRAQTMRSQVLPHGTPSQPLCNQEEDEYTAATDGEYHYIAMYSKGLAHDDTTGEVVPKAYCALLRGLQQDSVSGFDDEVGPFLGCRPTTAAATTATTEASRANVQVSSVAKQIRLVNPLAAQGFTLRGMDPQQMMLFQWGQFDANGQVNRIPMPLPPRFDSPEEIAEMAEVYWMALCRDVPFRDYATDPTTLAAARDLAQFEALYPPDYPRPGVVATDPTTLFRGFTKGDQIGPHVSQFFVRPVPQGALTIDPRIRTVKTIADGGRDYLTDFDSWLAVQKGCMPLTEVELGTFDPTPRLLRSGRDMGQYVHVDILYQEYFNACAILADNADTSAEPPPGLTVPRTSPGNKNRIGGGLFDPDKPTLIQEGDPYRPYDPLKPKPPFGSIVQQGFGTFGTPDFKVLLSEVSKLALKAAWYQKWCVHRRLRPEQFGGRIDRHKNGKRSYPFDASAFALLEAGVLPRVLAHNATFPPNPTDSYLLPMSFPEGCPAHPSYVQGHATVAGACVTVLKALFRDVSFADLNATVVEPTADGMALKVSAADPSTIRVHNELNKLASNVALARDFAGVHWRSDYIYGLKLGEAVAIWFLCDLRGEYAEHFRLQFKTFDDHEITIDNEFSSCFTSGQDAGLDAR